MSAYALDSREPLVHLGVAQLLDEVARRRVEAPREGDLGLEDADIDLVRAVCVGPAKRGSACEVGRVGLGHGAVEGGLGPTREQLEHEDSEGPPVDDLRVPVRELAVQLRVASRGRVMDDAIDKNRAGSVTEVGH